MNSLAILNDDHSDGNNIYVSINIVLAGLSFSKLLAGGFTAKAAHVYITMFCYYHML